MTGDLVPGAAGFNRSYLAERQLALDDEVVGMDTPDPVYDRSLVSRNPWFTRPGVGGAGTAAGELVPVFSEGTVTRESPYIGGVVVGVLG